jgi:hypothetical protein
MVTETTLKEKITAMLKENTGIHMLDSGGYGGRHWQRNQKRDFEKETDSSFIEWYRRNQGTGYPIEVIES